MISLGGAVGKRAVVLRSNNPANVINNGKIRLFRLSKSPYRVIKSAKFSINNNFWLPIDRNTGGCFASEEVGRVSVARSNQ